ncbi:helix-turn-helix domain-containing protein [Nitrolancea hollandica]|uniref:Excisionase/Xis, DNA-binding n=1 Tax=Nitrolancea hollandica Lb TaxID=1129897 RepID=I4ELJ6_9BACT
MEHETWYTIAEIVDMLKVHEQTVRRWIKTGELPAVALGRKAGYRIRKRDLDAFLEERMEGKDAA